MACAAAGAVFLAFFTVAFLTGANFLAVAFFAAAFLEGLFAWAASAALFAAQRFRVASPMALRADALILRRTFAGSGVDDSVSPFTFAQRAFCAAAIFRREYALNFRRLLPVGASEFGELMRAGLSPNRASTSAIWCWIFCS